MICSGLHSDLAARVSASRVFQCTRVNSIFSLHLGRAEHLPLSFSRFLLPLARGTLLHFPHNSPFRHFFRPLSAGSVQLFPLPSLDFDHPKSVLYSWIISTPCLYHTLIEPVARSRCILSLEVRVLVIALPPDISLTFTRCLQKSRLAWSRPFSSAAPILSISWDLVSVYLSCLRHS